MIIIEWFCIMFKMIIVQWFNIMMQFNIIWQIHHLTDRGVQELSPWPIFIFGRSFHKSILIFLNQFIEHSRHWPSQTSLPCRTFLYFSSLNRSFPGMQLYLIVHSYLSRWWASFFYSNQSGFKPRSCMFIVRIINRIIFYYVFMNTVAYLWQT